MNDFFVERFKNKPTSQLEDMVQNPDGFQAEAVKSAKYVLEQRNMGNKDFQEEIPKYLLKSEKESKFISRLNTSIKSIAVYQIISALLLLPSLLNFSHNSVLLYAISISFLFIYSLGLIGGIFLLLRNEKGFFLSKLFNAFQSIILVGGGISYTCLGLFSAYIHLKIFNGIQFGFGLDFGSKASLYFQDSNEILVGFNAVSIFALSILIKAHDSFKQSDQFDEELLNKKFN